VGTMTSEVGRPKINHLCKAQAFVIESRDPLEKHVLLARLQL